MSLSDSCYDSMRKDTAAFSYGILATYNLNLISREYLQKQIEP